MQYNSERKTNYDFLRVILVVLVVIGHSTFFMIDTPFGGIYYTKTMLENGIDITLFHKLVSVISSWIYTFHMPVFFGLSGSIFALSTKVPIKVFFIKKAKRLIIPFFVVWIFWNFPIKYLTGYYEGITIAGMLHQMLCPASVYLWYLESLFFVFILAYFIFDMNKKMQLTVVLFLYLVGVFISNFFGNYLPLGNPFYYLLWFYIGYNYNDYIKWFKAKKIWNDKCAVWAFCIHLILYVFNRLTHFDCIKQISVHLVYPLLMFFVLYYFSYRVDTSNNIYKKFSEYGMGIYLYAEPLNYLILYVFYRIFGIAYFGTIHGNFIIYIVRLIATPIVAIYITKLLKLLKLRYLY